MPEITSIYRSAEAEARSAAAYDAALARWPVPYREQDLPTRFGPTHVIVSGQEQATPILLLHGQDSSATAWVYNVAALSRRFRVMAVDTIGDFGKSRPTRLPANRDDYAAWLLDVLDGLGVQQARLAGLSYGGFLATNLALACPERVLRMVLLAPGVPNFGPMTLQWASAGIPMLFWPSRRTVTRFIGRASSAGYSASDPVHEQMIVGMTNKKSVSFPRPVFTDAELGGLRVPTLLMLGDHEIMYEPRKALERAAALIPGLQVQLVANAGHFLNSDQPGPVSECIADFLGAA